MDKNIAFNKIAEALLTDYSSVYYINARTNEYQSYSANGDFRSLQIDAGGDDFFKNIVSDVQKVVYEPDRELVIKALDKENISKTLKKGETQNIVYRLMIDGKPVYHTLKLIRNAHDGDDYYVIGVLNVDDEYKRKQKLEQVERERVIYNQIARNLADKYATIYYVNTKNDHYIEFSSSDIYKSLEVPTEGEDFFAESQKNIVRVINAEDLPRVIELMKKEILLSELEQKSTVAATYRLLLGDSEKYAKMSIMWAKDREHIIVGVEDVDREVRLEEQRLLLEKNNATYLNIADSLAAHYATIYYVNMNNDNYIEFSSSNIYKSLEVPESGENFFNESKKNIVRVIKKEDTDEILHILTKDVLLSELKEKRVVTATYRLLMGGTEKYARMSVMWAKDREHIIVGVEDVDEEIKREQKRRELEQKSITYNQIAISLANRYDSIYYVDAETNNYTEYNATEEYKSLQIQTSGEDFFADCEQNIRRVIYPDDMDMVLAATKKENLINALKNGNLYSIIYRLVINDEPKYVNLRVVWANDRRHLIIGLADIDEQIKKEQEHTNALRTATERAEKDSLTGVKNKTAYQEFEAELNKSIHSSEAADFAIVVCDVNGLKAVNDTQGHKAGDAYIRSACDLICEIYSHSPVFRIGGDEFVVVLTGGDYLHRNSLLERLREMVLINQNLGKVIIATGMSAFDPANDTAVASVFERADDLMYENKKTLKGARI